ncbi:vegetative cell wall protein gp1-like [Corvus moneduloides]|uniref:vegetative cell wall protein gp1-like n=1 Tax=Corvus moneduloides TaxID=1196302 RepID=UPI0013640A52|nr:vegetative cell wall protein gp1-like [Corvus moneduloides]
MERTAPDHTRGASPGAARRGRAGAGTPGLRLRPGELGPGPAEPLSPAAPHSGRHRAACGAQRGRPAPPRPRSCARPSAPPPRARPPGAAPLRQRSPARIPAAASPFREAGGVIPPSLPPAIPRRRAGPGEQRRDKNRSCQVRLSRAA